MQTMKLYSFVYRKYRTACSLFSNASKLRRRINNHTDPTVSSPQAPETWKHTKTTHPERIISNSPSSTVNNNNNIIFHLQHWVFVHVLWALQRSRLFATSRQNKTPRHCFQSPPINVTFHLTYPFPLEWAVFGFLKEVVQQQTSYLYILQ